MKKATLIVACAMAFFTSSQAFSEKQGKEIALEGFYSESAGIFAEEAKKARPQNVTPRQPRTLNNTPKRKFQNRAREGKMKRYQRDQQRRAHNESLWTFE